ncbi:hypothetical protein Patl1_35248 [Pistacia atlantica]|uniref:Uncharacterized protein n=1 Tax=Pistacia atlantica TaxID=434234 RepID=A0ACC0ZTC4_9ROSI|nr:hypothetical protein Patl1_35248 [Pistacia atlantica]
MDPKMVQAIVEWAIVEWLAPMKVTKLKSFLGLADYYRKFIVGFSRKATLLMNLLTKEQW